MLLRLQTGMLCLADRGFNGAEQWRQASATGCWATTARSRVIGC
jgi:hypothetical protein